MEANQQVVFRAGGGSGEMSNVSVGKEESPLHQTTLATHPLGVKTLILLRGVDASYGGVFVGGRGMRPEWARIGPS